MFPYNWNGFPVNDPMGEHLAMLTRLDPDLKDLPEDVRHALEEHQDEIYGPEDIRRIAGEQLLRR